MKWGRIALSLALAVLVALSTAGLSEVAVDAVGEPEAIPAVSVAELSGELAKVDLSGELAGVDLSGAGCLGPVPEASPAQAGGESATVFANDEDITLGVGEVHALDTASLGKKLAFASSKPSVASVSKKGRITAKKKGSAVVTVTKGKKEVARYTVRVLKAPAKVSLSVGKLTIGRKESVTLEPRIDDNTHASFTWSSEDKSIATVSKTGSITGRKVGQTTVTVTTHNGKAARVTVTVAKAPSKVTMNRKKATMKPGETLKLKATLPKGSASHAMTWKSSSAKVATVSRNGKVTAVGAGKARITATTFNGQKAVCTVTVPSVWIDYPSLYLFIDETYSVDIHHSGGGKLRYTCDEHFVRCSWDGDWENDYISLKVTATGIGSTVITVTDPATGDSVDIAITVEPKYTELSNLEWIYIEYLTNMIDDTYSYYTADHSLEDDHFGVRVYSAHNNYYRDYSYFFLGVGGYREVESIILYKGGKYTLYGVEPGDSLASALSMLEENGCVLIKDENGRKLFRCDSGVLSLEFDSDTVTYVSWSAGIVER